MTLSGSVGLEASPRPAPLSPSRTGQVPIPAPDPCGLMLGERLDAYRGPSSMLVTLKLLSTLTVTWVPSALVMCAS